LLHAQIFWNCVGPVPVNRTPSFREIEHQKIGVVAAHEKDQSTDETVNKPDGHGQYCSSAYVNSFALKTHPRQKADRDEEIVTKEEPNGRPSHRDDAPRTLWAMPVVHVAVSRPAWPPPTGPVEPAAAGETQVTERSTPHPVKGLYAGSNERELEDALTPRAKTSKT